MYQELRKEVKSLLSKNTRLDGRKPLEHREIKIEYDVTRNAEGSAKVKFGDTEVIAGVKMEVMKPYPDTPGKGSIMVNCELYPMSSPEFESGPPNIHAIELARVTDRGIRESGAIDFEKLCITPGEQCWMAVVDVCTINDDGGLYDAIPLAAMAALNDTKFPEFDGEKINYKVKTDKALGLAKQPITITVYKCGNGFFIDPATQEEKVYDARLTVSVLDNDNMCSFQKGGSHSLTTDDILKMIEIAIDKSKEYRAALKR
ncbi:exosome complex protein Rrp42 [Candidatus Woesearchaeota archaeon]|jgi:exosome complex component RRP42|nr:exosome complex protein Rrp42 [Candidatus Woesearchaeota archaeon]MBT6519082.1 exosome complex protein Rrp42 [Candidatus Woesearchaeota archaeon]MBT7367025.1 exosome complex protein Rrp42 [Candidatus Woesearchaeota archaeon]